MALWPAWQAGNRHLFGVGQYGIGGPGQFFTRYRLNRTGFNRGSGRHGRLREEGLRTHERTIRDALESRNQAECRIS